MTFSTILPQQSFCLGKEILPSCVYQFSPPSGGLIIPLCLLFFLCSMRSGACGINLTQANRVFILEPVFNPGLLAQSIGRVHRLGQKRPVEVVLLRMKDSIDTRMTKMVELKYGNRADDSQALVGHVSTDKAEVVAAEFDLLFGFEGPQPQPPALAGAGAAAAAAAGGGGAMEGGDDAMMLLPEPVLSARRGDNGRQAGMI